MRIIINFLLLTFLFICANSTYAYADTGSATPQSQDHPVVGNELPSTVEDSQLNQTPKQLEHDDEQVASENCKEDRIKSKTPSGYIFVLETGSIVEVNPSDRVSATFWLPLDNVLLCDNILINTSSGEQISVRRVK